MHPHFSPNTSPDALQKSLNAMAAILGDRAFAERVAGEIFARAQPQQAVA